MLHQSNYILFLFLLFVIPYKGITQYYDATLNELDKIDEAQEKIAHINDLLNTDIYLNSPDTLALLNYTKASILFDQTVSIESAITALDNGLSMISYDVYPNIWIKLWYYKGFYYRKWDKYEEAKDALSIVLNHKQNNKYLWDATIQMGKTFKDRGEFSLALDYYRKAISLSEDDKYELTTTYEVIAFVYLIMETKEGAKNALPWIEKLIDLLNTMEGEDHFKASMTYNKACAYMTLEDWKNARIHFEESERIMNNCCQDEDFKSLILESKAVLLKEEGKYQEAIDHFEKSLALYQHSFDLTRSDGLASTYASMAETYLKMKDHESALKYINMALDYRLSGIDQDIKSRPISKNLIITNGEKHYLIDELLTKGLILEEIADINQSSSLRQEAIETFSYADYVVDKMRFEHLEESTKQFWREKTIEVYQHLVCNYAKISNIEMAFHYTEKSKYLLMGEHLVRNHTTQLLSGFPAELKASYSQIQNEISIQLATLENNQLINLDHEIDSIELLLIDLHKKEDDILSVIKNDHPNFFSNNFTFQLASVEEIKNNLLKENQTLIEYYLADSSIYIFVINQDDIFLKEVKIDKSITPIITRLRSNIIHPNRYKPEFLIRYAQDASELYEILIAPVENKLHKNLIIVADNIMTLVPFSILLSERLAAKSLKKPLIEWPYLLYQYQISFLHSASLELLNKKKNSDVEYDYNLLAFNPSFTNKKGKMAMQRGDTIRSALLPLLGSIEEIEFAKKLFSGPSFIDSEATEFNLKKALNSTYAIFHIASHAIVDDKFPNQSKLVLSPESTNDGMLHTNEINNLNLKSDLLILSACNTGVGKLTNGEGINSLARSFAHAGSHNLLMSLWPVSDRSTTSLIKEYYKELINGKSKRTALTEAKNSFLNSVPAAFHHPYFWGGFVYYGDDNALRINPNFSSTKKWTLAFCGLSLLGLVYYFKIKK